MKCSKRHQQWIVLNVLMFLPWASCGRIEFDSNSEEEFQPRSRSIYFPDDEDRPVRSSYRGNAIRDQGYTTSRYRRVNGGSNPDFFFDYARDEAETRRHPPTDNSVYSGRDTRPRTTTTTTTTTPAPRAPEFSYQDKDKNGPSNWHRNAPQCGGRYQSPVMLNSTSALFVRNKRPLQLIGQTNQPLSIKLANDGHSAKFTFVWNEGERPYIRGGPLKNKYFFEQFHFHWGANNSIGSEHVLDYRRFPLEVHLVFYNGLYESFDAAKEQVDGLSVMGLFYTIDDEYEEQPNQWTRFLREVIEPGSEYNVSYIDSFSVYDVIGDIDWTYFSYEGSLTTPPCLETVTWIVAARPLPIKSKELREFRWLRSRSGAMANNFRPVQKLFNRRVFLY
ncbi:carbonic anhydrase 2-like [Uranotaenia lowii]|uniref:carbonic anhydrase 2-like n=1 Tax=Uranotaenia lowii TaxID=190385 RepID=UPI00247A4DAD|nr:carbonic anhydrase 2-like [Uranotaenia lowii]XP_055586532.1 carbonic anhydrase 2-like [Uranotaenia lowii]